MHGPQRLGPGPGVGLGGGGAGDGRNMILAVVLSMLVLFGFEYFFAQPQRAKEAAARRAEQAAVAEQQARPGGVAEAAPGAPVERPAALAATSRVSIDNASVDGSLSLTGARFDDLSLKRYRQSVDPSSPEVTLLNPQGSKGAYDAYFGWEDAHSGADLAGARTAWALTAGTALTAQTPITLTATTPDGLTITRTISLDDKYMFTVRDVVENASAAERTVRPFSVVRRRDKPADFVPNQIVHQGLVGVLGAQHLLEEATYQKAEKHARAKAKGERQPETPIEEFEGPGGWLGVSDHYWLAALIPAQSETIRATFDATPHPGYNDYRAQYVGASRTVPAGGRVEYTQHFFAGAKNVDVLQTYEKQLGAPSFDKAVDWGNFWFLTRPFFMLLSWLQGLVGNFGLAILLSTVVVKLVLFPLVNSSYEAMSKLRKVQPKMKEIQERFAADKQRQQQEMVKLYQQEKINPVAGCLPILLQIPIFYALYKVLTVTIEMRHAPFFGWIQDLSARDPTTIFNLFGLLPAIGLDFQPQTWPVIGTFLWLGAWPILYGITMWAVQALSPPPPDPIQARIFALLPILFTFMFASFAAGLVIYWTWSNMLTILQQYVIMRKNGVETELDKLVAKLGKKAPA